EVGVGSTFTFTLPVADERPHSGPLPEGEETWSAVASSSLVLLVEDEAQAVELLRLQLEGAGFGVAIARDGATGLDLARRLRPAAIVLDILLPKLDGWELLAQLKADPITADIPVIVASIVDERGRGVALGAAEYLIKPVDRGRLQAALRRAIRAAPARDGPATVLAIDDDPLALELVEAVLA